MGTAEIGMGNLRCSLVLAALCCVLAGFTTDALGMDSAPADNKVAASAAKAALKKGAKDQEKAAEAAVAKGEKEQAAQAAKAEKIQEQAKAQAAKEMADARKEAAATISRAKASIDDANRKIEHLEEMEQEGSGKAWDGAPPGLDVTKMAKNATKLTALKEAALAEMEAARARSAELMRQAAQKAAQEQAVARQAAAKAAEKASEIQEKLEAKFQRKEISIKDQNKPMQQALAAAANGTQANATKNLDSAATKATAAKKQEEASRKKVAQLEEKAATAKGQGKKKLDGEVKAAKIAG